MMTEKYIAQARYEAGESFGQPFPALPENLLEEAAEGFGAAVGVSAEGPRSFLGKFVRRRGLEPLTPLGGGT